MHFDIVADKFRDALATTINENVKKYNYRIITGFIGTPYLLFALADNGYAETAGKVLLNSGYPGWLYEVDVGATTVWERWNTLMPDGKPNLDGMNSCNHYAYGSVLEFIYTRIAGIQPTSSGFKTVKISPTPCKELASVQAEYDSANGKIIAGYEQKNSKIKFFAEVSNGIDAQLCVPDIGVVAKGSGRLEYECDWENLDVPHFTLDSSLSEVFSNPKASAAFTDVFKKLFHPLEFAYLKASSEKISFVSDYLIGKGRVNGKEFSGLLDKFNNLFAG